MSNPGRGVVEELARRIEAAAVDYPDVRHFTSAWNLLHVPGFEWISLTPTLEQVQCALELARQRRLALKNSVGAALAQGKDIR